MNPHKTDCYQYRRKYDAYGLIQTFFLQNSCFQFPLTIHRLIFSPLFCTIAFSLFSPASNSSFFCVLTIQLSTAKMAPFTPSPSQYPLLYHRFLTFFACFKFQFLLCSHHSTFNSQDGTIHPFTFSIVLTQTRLASRKATHLIFLVCSVSEDCSCVKQLIRSSTCSTTVCHKLRMLIEHCFRLGTSR